MIKVSKKGSGYITYILPMGKNKGQEKISYVAGINKWNMYIGVGEVLRDIDKLIKEKKENLLSSLYEDIMIIVSFGIIFLILFYLIFKNTKSTFSTDIEYLIKSIGTLVNKNEKINTKNIYFKEFQQISEQTNNLLDDKKKMEIELRKKESLLYHQAKMASMGEMLENIAHQWRQPLSVITTVSSSIQLKKEYDMLDDTFLDESLESINENALYLSSTIEDFRNFFLPNKQKEIFLLKVTVEKSLKLLHSKLTNKNIKIQKDLSGIEINSYKNELIQVILVLLNNSKDALESIEGDRYIFIKIYKDEKHGYIEIKDNAQGIDKNIQEKIFEPYFTTKHKSQGTGIGLYMAREIIVKHIHGEIIVKNDNYTYNNKKYLGAKFTIKIPL